MRLIRLTVENFRCYSKPTSIRFDDMTALIGQNDVGKSALMDALAIFFEETEPDKDDACKLGDPTKMRFTCEFDQLPDKLIVDSDYPTSLGNEYLLNDNGNLVIRKTYNGQLAKPKLSAIEAIALHPTAEGYSDLLQLKKADLAKRAQELGVDLSSVDKRKNAPVRAAIWAAAPDLQIKEVAVPLEGEGAKQIWTALLHYLPTYALFKSDRASTDQDAEAQDPLKSAISEALKAVERQLLEIKEYVEREVRKIGVATVEKLREIDPSVAETLDPVITTKKWESLFQTSITGDYGIPLNKRGSGVKRLVLLSFFRAKAEKDAIGRNSSSIIYAIEEPETSQHPRNQRLLLAALRDLAAEPGRQIIITTHTPMLARYLPSGALRYLKSNDRGERVIVEGNDETLAEIARSLGVLPDHNVKLFIGVEGVNDINFLKGISKVLKSAGEDVLDLESLEMNGDIIFVPFGGGNLALWASRLKHLNRPEYHICDRDDPPPDPPKYSDYMAAVNAREGCTAVATSKREMENYLHPDAIVEAYRQNGLNITLPAAFADFDDVPTIVAQAVHSASSGVPWQDLSEEKRVEKVKRVKRQLNAVAPRKMTVDRLRQTDPNNEIRGWLNRISELVRAAEL